MDLSREFDSRAERRIEQLTSIDNRLWSFFAGRMGVAIGDGRSGAVRFSAYKERVARVWSPIDVQVSRPTAQRL